MTKFARPAMIAAMLLASAASAAAEGPPQVQPIPDDVWNAMQGKSWHENFGCPAREALALVSVPYFDFEGKSQTGKLIVKKELGEEMFKIFEELHATQSLRIARMDLIDVFDGKDGPSMKANNTSAFNCRFVTGSTTKLSSHSFGTAIDINPVQNPYVKRRVTEPNPEGLPFDTIPERAAALEANTNGIIGRKGATVKIFKMHGWTWGGDFNSLKDYQHFSKDGN